MAANHTSAGKNGGSPPSETLPEGWQEWPTLSEAANLIGMPRKKLSEFVKLGVVKKIVGPKGALGGYRLNPDDLRRLEEQVDEEDDTAQRAAPTRDDVNKAAVDGMKLAQEHARALVTLFENPYQHVLKTLREENESLRAELKQMRSERASDEARREAERSTRAVELVALKEVEGEQETKREAWALARKVGEYVVRKKMIGDGVDPRLVALHEAMSKIPRESFEVLFTMGVLPKDAEAKLKEGLDWKDEPAAAPAAAAESAPAATTEPAP